MRDLTLKQLSSVPCPTCGVAPVERCLLHSGAPRSEPHEDRKLVAAEEIEKKRMPHGPIARKPDQKSTALAPGLRKVELLHAA